MIDGHKISPLLPLPHIDCCAKAFIDTSTELPKAEEQEETSEEEIAKNTDVQADKQHKEGTENGASAAWVFKPSVGTWLVPVHAHAEAEVETAPKALEISVPAVSEPKAVKVAKVQRKGLGARIKTWFCCVQASAAEPKPVKAAKTDSSKPLTKKVKSCRR
jgi:hypothetical protein